MTKRAALLALLFALVGLGASVTAASVHYHLLNDPHYTSFCDINGTVSCTLVYQSRFGTLWGVPVSIFGGIWFACAALLSVGGLVARPDVREAIPGYLFVLSAPALAAALYLLYASVFVLQSYCPMCLLTDAAIVGLFIVSWVSGVSGVSGAAASVPMTTLPGRLARDLRALAGSRLALAVTVLFVAGAASALAFFPREGDPGAAPATPTADERNELEQFMSQAARIPLVIPRDGAKVLIVKFNDFQCPACGKSYLSYKPILAKYESQYPGAVRMVLKDYPLNANCNPGASMLHGGACHAAAAVRLAREHNRGEAMEEWLYTHQSELTPDTVKKAALEVGQVADFDAKYAATIELVKADVALGAALGINSTPTFFINGVKVEGMWATQYFDQAIAYELQHPPAQ